MVLIVDYGLGNLRSVRRALEECGATVKVSARPEDLADCSRAVLPGVGSFADGMRNLNERGFGEALPRAAAAGLPVLGICLGMQLLADHGTEGGGSPGLALVPGQVIRFQPAAQDVRIPHVGWNEIEIQRPHPLFSNIANHSDFYFVHSYYFVPASAESILATTPYCGGFASVVTHQSVIGVQFHPEKSSKLGFRMLRNFLEL